MVPRFSMHRTGGTFASRLVRATRGSDSLRTTVPQVIAVVLELRAGDALVWSIDPGGTYARIARAPRVPVDPDRPAATIDIALRSPRAPAARPAD